MQKGLLYRWARKREPYSSASGVINHAWSYEPVTMADIKTYKPEAKSVGSGQVLTCP